MLAVTVLLGFAAALVAPALSRWLRGATGWCLALLPAVLTLYFASLLPCVAAGEPEVFRYAWVPSLGVYLSFRADALSLLFALLISGVGVLVTIYSGGYLKDQAQLGRYYAWLLTFMASMLGVVLADNLILLVVFWELTSLSSYLLIGFEHERETARQAAWQALLVTGVGGLALLVGFLLLAKAAHGTLEFSMLLRQGEALQAHPLYLPALLLILSGAFTKSAQFPFHFWLPNAMEAPTPVSAYLHSVTMVKAGVYLLMRLSPALGGTAWWLYAGGGIGAITMLLGGYLAVLQTDLKRLLAYATVSVLGSLTLLLSLCTPLALQTAVILLLAHALYKGALFLIVGVVDHATGSRDVTQLGGLFRAMPITAGAACMAALSMAGLPPLLGFMAKELIYQVGLRTGLWLLVALVVTGVFTVCAACCVGVEPFFASAPREPSQPWPKAATHTVPLSLWGGPVILAGLSLLMGLFPDSLLQPLVGPTAAAIIGRPPTIHLGLWHGFVPILALSVMTVLAGVGLYTRRLRLRSMAYRLIWPWGPAHVYEQTLAAMNRLAHAQTRLLQSGYLRYYLLTIVLTTTGLLGITLVSRGGLSWSATVPDLRFYEIGLAVLILLAAGAAVVSRSRLGAVAALGVAGYGVALMYLLFGAPDLAMTSFLIESLTVILFVLVFYHLPHFAQLTSRYTRARDAFIALLAGGLITILVLLAVGIQLHPSIARYFAAQALPLAHGRNIVNVILVDFRALDTLGEITVLGIAAVGVYALLKLRKDTPP
jgi:multicomponent Na+:H+ antiporter subunit A